MNIQEHTQPEKLEKCSFIWSIARLFIASIALFLGGFPLALKIAPSSFYGLVNSLLTVSWIISGLTSGYLIYAWFKKGKTIFGGKDKKDLTAFWIMIITGFNLGLAGIFGSNIGMNISNMNKTIFVFTGFIYIITAVYLIKRYKDSGKTLF